MSALTRPVDLISASLPPMAKERGRLSVVGFLDADSSCTYVYESTFCLLSPGAELFPIHAPLFVVGPCYSLFFVVYFLRFDVLRQVFDLSRLLTSLDEFFFLFFAADVRMGTARFTSRELCPACCWVLGVETKLRAIEDEI